MTDVPRDDAPAATSKSARPAHDIATATVTINRPAADLYAFWRDFSNLATVMENVERVDMIGTDRAHWVVRAPAGRTVEWDARVTHDVPDREIGWRAEDGADIPNSGRVTFADAGTRGTIVSAVIHWDPPGGLIGKTVAKLFQREPAIQARRDLRRFKQLMETGEIATSARNPAGLTEEQG